MANRKKLEQELSQLVAIEVDPTAEDTCSILDRALQSPSNFVVAHAAAIVGAWQLAEFEPQLTTAFLHFVDDPIKRDPTCAAKRAVAEALLELESPTVDVFLAGIRHRQLEPVYGGSEDTAAPLRAICAVGLARSGYPDVMIELAKLLADPEPDARIGAVKALTYATQPGGLPLLWFKTLLGDSEPSVLISCFAALLALDPDAALPLVGGYLAEEEAATAEAAALALGESRLPEALAYLQSAWEMAGNPAVRRTVLLAIALLRTDGAVDYLINLLDHDSEAVVEDVLAALEMYRSDASIWRRVAAAYDRSRR